MSKFGGTILKLVGGYTVAKTAFNAYDIIADAYRPTPEEQRQQMIARREAEQEQLNFQQRIREQQEQNSKDKPPQL